MSGLLMAEALNSGERARSQFRLDSLSTSAPICVINVPLNDFRRERQTAQCRVTAVAAPVDGYSFWISQALVNCPLQCVSQVALHRSTPFTETSSDPIATIASGASKIALEHLVAAISQKLNFSVEVPLDPCQRSSVHMNHSRHW
ncbi:hypothetical protein T09_7856 [Trichinella sp. T9]|nr:hypothetical protein T09_7856 [Trichinella sp. T9]